MANILHITAHLGGGVGKILSSVCCNDKNHRHKILCLEPTKNLHFYNVVKEHGIEVYLMNSQDVSSVFQWADIVELEWWHHPLVTQFMVQTLSRIKTRLLVWCHISGCNYPCLPFGLIKCADQFLFTSEYSYDNPVFSEQEKEYILSNCDVVRSVGTEFHSQYSLTPHDGFIVGYVGYLGYSKLRKNFVDLCKGVSYIPNISFSIVGDLADAENLLDDIRHSGISDRFHILGYQQNVFSCLSNMDVFGYPLSPDHTGTTENALLEAMSVGVVPVVFNQCCEKYLVKDQETGLLVNTDEEYIEAIHDLYSNSANRMRLSFHAREYTCSHFGLSKTLAQLNHHYSKLMDNFNKTEHEELRDVFGLTPYDWFCSCYAGDIRHVSGLAMAETKGSLRQYCLYFPQDTRLQNCLKGSEIGYGRN